MGRHETDGQMGGHRNMRYRQADMQGTEGTGGTGDRQANLGTDTAAHPVSVLGHSHSSPDSCDHPTALNFRDSGPVVC